MALMVHLKFHFVGQFAIWLDLRDARGLRFQAFTSRAFPFKLRPYLLYSSLLLLYLFLASIAIFNYFLFLFVVVVLKWNIFVSFFV